MINTIEIRDEILNNLEIEYSNFYPDDVFKAAFHSVLLVNPLSGPSTNLPEIHLPNVKPGREIYDDAFRFIEDRVDDIQKLVNLFKTNQKDILIGQIETWARTTRKVIPDHSEEWNPGADNANRIYIILKRIIG